MKSRHPKRGVLTILKSLEIETVSASYDLLELLLFKLGSALRMASVLSLMFCAVAQAESKDETLNTYFESSQEVLAESRSRPATPLECFGGSMEECEQARERQEAASPSYYLNSAVEVAPPLLITIGIFNSIGSDEPSTGISDDSYEQEVESSSSYTESPGYFDRFGECGAISCNEQDTNDYILNEYFND